jgi:hypothetical protein
MTHRRAPDQAVIFLEPLHGRVIDQLTSVNPLIGGYFCPGITRRSSFLIRFARSKQAPDAIIKSFEASLHRGIIVKRPTVLLCRKGAVAQKPIKLAGR